MQITPGVKSKLFRQSMEQRSALPFHIVEMPTIMTSGQWHRVRTEEEEYQDNHVINHAPVRNKRIREDGQYICNCARCTICIGPGYFLYEKELWIERHGGKSRYICGGCARRQNLEDNNCLLTYEETMEFGVSISRQDVENLKKNWELNNGYSNDKDDKSNGVSGADRTGEPRGSRQQDLASTRKSFGFGRADRNDLDFLFAD